MLIEDVTPEWEPCPDEPGCVQKTIVRGNATIIVIRPILSPEEQKKREAELVAASEHFLACVERQRRLGT